MADDSELRRIVEQLAATGRARLEHHPLSHLARGPAATLEITVPIPLEGRGSALDDAVALVRSRLDAEIDALLARRATFRPGRVFCLRCGTSDCEHGAPADSRQVFAGFGPSGKPRFVDFGQWLLQRQHPDVDRLYDRPPQLLTDIVSGRELLHELLPAFRDRDTGYHIHGQVTAGWFRLPSSGGMPPEPLALTFQVISSRRQRAKGRQLGLNVLGIGPGGMPLGVVFDQLGEIPWSAAVAWGQSVISSIERSQGKKSATPEVLSERIEGLLGGIARRLEQGRRARDRRTQHAHLRHETGDRPTRMALQDAAAASPDCFLFDTRRGTAIVLGERGRAHVFSLAGKLVTSIRYSTDAIERRKKQEIWREATREEIAQLRKKICGQDAAGG